MKERKGSGIRRIFIILVVFLSANGASIQLKVKEGHTRATLDPIPGKLDSSSSFVARKAEEYSSIKGKDIVAFRNLLEEKPQQSDQKSTNGSSAFPVFRYLSNESLEKHLKSITERCRHISHMYSIGKSVKGFPLWAIEISDRPNKEEAEPYFKFVGNIHGDEPLGRQLLIYLADWLCDNYQKDKKATFIVDNVHLHLLPSMNPDGFKHRLRNNLNDVDLNRDFPDQFLPLFDDESKRQPEVQAIMRWSREKMFTASASLHEGAIVANYPWDGGQGRKKEYAGCPDDATFRQLAEAYSRNHPQMRNSSEFEKGVTNGANWYPVYGGMQDWNYIKTGCFEVTLELNQQKWPPIHHLPELWRVNQPPMLALVEHVLKTGIHGRVLSGATKKPIPATVKVAGIEKHVVARPKTGYFHRLLVPGTYHVSVSCQGHKQKGTIAVVVPGVATSLDFILDPEEGGRVAASERGSRVGVGVRKVRVGTWANQGREAAGGPALKREGAEKLPGIARIRPGKKGRTNGSSGSGLGSGSYGGTVWADVGPTAVLAGASFLLLICIAYLVLGGRRRSRLLKLSNL